MNRANEGTLEEKTENFSISVFATFKMHAPLLKILRIRVPHLSFPSLKEKKSALFLNKKVLFFKRENSEYVCEA